MKYARDVHGLRRYIFISQAVSLLVFLFGLVSLLLFIQPSLVGTPVEQQASYRGDPIWLFVGIGFLLLATFFLIVPGRWSRRLLWILKNVKPEPMNLSIQIDKDSDHTSYFALLNADQEGLMGEARWKVSLYPPSWDITVLQGRQVPVKVYFDPESKKPGVIETQQGLLWSMAGSGSVLEDHPERML